VTSDATKEFHTPERCWILESWNTPDDPKLSIARARVEPGVATAWHAVEGTEERYLIVSGTGSVEVGELSPADVTPGDVVFIPAGMRQRITNTGPSDLVFYALCTPRFDQKAYRDLDAG
jgi:mannose-6-phosphate isomerase-like protein (cupin superfamily)